MTKTPYKPRNWDDPKVISRPNHTKATDILQIMCPECGNDISDTIFTVDTTDPRGHLDIGYECDDCGIEVYIYKVQRQMDEEEEERGEI